MGLGAPPATAGGLEEQGGSHLGGERGFVQVAEVIGVIGQGQVVELFNSTRVSGGNGFATMAKDDSPDVVDRPPGGEALQQAGEAAFRLAAADEIDNRKLAMQFEAHFALPIGAAEQDAKLRVAVFESFGEGEGGDVLLESGREADNVVPGPI